MLSFLRLQARQLNSRTQNTKFSRTQFKLKGLINKHNQHLDTLKYIYRIEQLSSDVTVCSVLFICHQGYSHSSLQWPGIQLCEHSPSHTQSCAFKCSLFALATLHTTLIALAHSRFELPQVVLSSAAHTSLLHCWPRPSWLLEPALVPVAVYVPTHGLPGRLAS